MDQCLAYSIELRRLYRGVPVTYGHSGRRLGILSALPYIGKFEVHIGITSIMSIGLL
jgi:hypothetical protein